jgi:hypothetical protein
MEKASRLEQYLIPRGQWATCPIPGVLAYAEYVTNVERYPIGIGCTPQGTWFMLTSGQGPIMEWEEGEPVPEVPSGHFVETLTRFTVWEMSPEKGKPENIICFLAEAKDER